MRDDNDTPVALTPEELMAQSYWLKKDGYKKVVSHIKAREAELEKLYEIIRELAKENDFLKERLSELT